MRIARALLDGEPWFITVEGRHASPLIPSPGTTTGSAQFTAVREALATSRRSGPALGLDDVELLCPVVAPQKVLTVGLNYHGHAAEAGLPLPHAPVIMTKWPSALIGSGDEIRVSRAHASELDYECELAVVIGRRVRDVDEGDALAAVLGYTVCNDITARDAQFRDGQWCRSKSFDTFCPIGPWIVTAEEVPDPQGLEVTCQVNGEQRQSGNTADMVFGVAQIISYLSRFTTLEPGDVVSTGTPAGVGFGMTPPTYLTDGDVITCHVEGVGTLSNRVILVP